MGNSREDQFDELIRNSGVRLSFSKNCHSGTQSLISPDHACGCWRCRKSRGEEWTAETEAQAAEDSRKASAIFRERTLKFLKGDGDVE